MIYTVHYKLFFNHPLFYYAVHPKLKLIPFEAARQEKIMIRNILPSIILGLGWLIRPFDNSEKTKTDYSEMIITSLQSNEFYTIFFCSC